MIPGNSCGERRNHLLQIRLTSDEAGKLEQMAEKYSATVSDLVRERMFGHAVDCVKQEINRAVNSIRKGYNRAKQNVYDTLYSAMYEPVMSYSGSQNYR